MTPGAALLVLRRKTGHGVEMVSVVAEVVAGGTSNCCAGSGKLGEASCGVGARVTSQRQKDRSDTCFCCGCLIIAP